MGQEGVNKKAMASKPQRAAALTKLALCVVAALLVVWFADTTRSACNGTKARDAWTLPRPLAAQKASASNGGVESTARSTWGRHAMANLTEYKNTILSRVKPHYGKQDWWQVYLPSISCPPDRPLTRYGGTGDGSKLLCNLSGSLQETSCIIYSLGSNGDYAFEHTMMEKTRCAIHTFDCTHNGISQSPGRHFYHHWCLGEQHHGEQYRTWKNITTTLGHTKVHLLKMDIEGYEHDVLPAWRPEDNLPDELSIEIHAQAGQDRPGTTAELGLTFLHLANLGYAAYSQEINPLASVCCAEFSFMRLGHVDE